MGCFISCFGGGDGDRRRPRRRSRRRSPPRPNHVSVVRATSLAADVVVRDAKPPLRGAKASKPQLAVEVPGEVVRAAPAADAVAREASLVLRGGEQSKPQLAVEVPADVAGPTPVTADVVGEASDRLLKEEALPASVGVAKELVTNSNPDMNMRESSEQEAPFAGSLLPKKKATSQDIPVKCSPMVVAPVCTQGSFECSPVTAAVVSASDSELRKLSEQGSRSSGKKKVTFNMNITTYENAAAPDQEEGYAEDEGENHSQNVAALPENHRYKNCSDSDDDVRDEYAEDDAYGDDSDEEDDYVDCNMDLLDKEKMSSEEHKQDSHESLFSLSISNDQQNGDEVISPAPKSSDTSVEKESPLIKGNNLHCRSKYVRPVLNPVQNLSEWKEVKSLKTQPASSKKFNKENVNIVPEVGADCISNSAIQAKVGAGNSSKKEVSVDASLSTWLASSDNLTVDKVQNKSPCSILSVSQDEMSSASIIDDLKKSSAASSPQRSPRHNCEGTPILGTVGSYWSCMMPENDHCSSTSDSGMHGIPNTTSKYKEDQRVNWHSTPFNVRLDKALKKAPAS